MPALNNPLIDRRSPERRPRRAAYALPTLFTAGNIFLGYLAILRSFRGAMLAVAGAGGAAGAALWVDAGFGYLMVYTGDTLGEVSRRRRAVAIEPMTCPPNALRTGKDLVSLEPGAEWSASWGIVPR